ncbi:MAG: hypothetical protein ACI837_002863 [Crocinitomicaceae bacterium]|jgi:hypothetical protein
MALQEGRANFLSIGASDASMRGHVIPIEERENYVLELRATNNG